MEKPNRDFLYTVYMHSQAFEDYCSVIMRHLRMNLDRSFLLSKNHPPTVTDVTGLEIDSATGVGGSEPDCFDSCQLCQLGTPVWSYVGPIPLPVTVDDDG